MREYLLTKISKLNMPRLLGAPRQKSVFILWAIVAVATARDSPIFEKKFLNRLWKKKNSPLAIVFIIFTLKLVEELRGHISEELGHML